MTWSKRLLGSPIFETYILNMSQLFHMVILAVVVPWYIGVTSYGVFAALIALPGLVQSSFEVICVTVLSEYRRRDLLRRIILFFALPLLTAIIAGFIILLNWPTALMGSFMAALLLMRSYAFSIAIVAGSMTKRIVQSEAIIFAIYAGVLSACVLAGIRDETVPILMIIGASLSTTVFLLSFSRTPVVVLPPGADNDRPRLPFMKFAHASSLRLFEDGFLTLPPLVLALVISPAVAGQFRIFVSVAKFGYKFYPFRYEVILRDLNTGQLAFKLLAASVAVFSLAAPVVAGILYVMLKPGEHGMIVALVAACGAVVASLAMFPAASSTNGAMLALAIVCLAACFAAAYLSGLTGFVVVYFLACGAIAVASLIVIGRAARARTKAVT